MFNIAFTGHRPNSNPCNSKLFGLTYNNFLTSPRALRFIDVIADKLLKLARQHKEIRVYTGMALGVDQMIAVAAFKARETAQSENLKIIVHAAIPCENHPSKWPVQSQKIYHDILARCDERHIVHKGNYNSSCMQERNEYMVDNCDHLVAIWDGSSGGTGNCVHYAESKSVQIEIIPPSQFAK